MRLAILGNSGSGKSSLARAVASATGAPVLDLDSVAWEPGSAAVLRPPGEAASAVRNSCRSTDEWIVEGCYANLIAVALEFNPKLVFLNPGREVCQANCRARPWEPHKFSNPEEQQAALGYLLSWVAEYYTRQGDLSLEGHLECFSAYTGPKLELRSPPTLSPVETRLLAWLR
jgi:adenylate kinase family enzyme